MRSMIVWIVVLVACNEGSARVPRWPDHRHHHDDQLERLLAKTATQERELAELKQRLARVEAALVQTAPSAPPPPAAATQP